MTNGRIALGDALDIAAAELDTLIDRHFAAHRTLLVSNDEGKFWTAAIGDTVLYRSPDALATLRFANTFAARTHGVTVECEPAAEWLESYSVKVPAADNVVPIRKDIVA